ncbi:phytoene desaturase [bacterium]|nr:phytoene desaturase [bacterium]
MSKHVVIIGAGPGGLATALQLANSGLRVTLLEKQHYVGGRTSALRDQGFTFDRGPTFFLYPRILEEIFASLGRDLYQEIPMQRLDPQYRLAFATGGKIDATPDVARLKEQVAQISPRDAQQVDSFLRDNRTKLKHFAPILENEFSCWRQLFTPKMLSLLPLVKVHRSLEQDLRSYFHDPRVRLSFSFQSKYLGMSPFQCPSLFSILSFLEYEYGVFHPTGGCSRVSERMAEIAREMGVDIRLGEEVQKLRFSGRKVTGAITCKGEYACDALVINADFARAMLRLVPESLRPRWNNRKLGRCKYSCSTYMLYLGVKGSVDLPHHVIYFSSEYEQNLKDITDHYRLSRDPSFYLQNACMTDPSLAPPGCSTLYCLVPVPHLHPNLDWQREGARLRQVAFEQMARLGLYDLESRVIVEHQVTPDDWAAMEIHRGATFSMAHTLDQMLFLRPQNRYQDLDGVYLVGGSTHPGSGLPVIYSSARITCRALTGDLGASWREESQLAKV